MHQKKSIRTVVISGRGMRRFFIISLSVLGIAAIAVLCSAVARLPGCTAGYAQAIIEKRLLGSDMGKTNISRTLLGFDIDDSKTILYKFYSQFGELEPVVEAVESAPVEVETPEPPPKVEEINSARGMALSNASGISISPTELIAEPLHIQVEQGAPQILIVHTHTTESFTDAGKTKYTASESDRSTDADKNMIAVGKAMQEVFTERGIESVHDTTVHDYPSYSGAYTRSMSTMTSNLSKYPSIKIVLDVHRDGITRDDGTKVKVAADIDGAKAAQCMFVVGTNAKLTHETWRDNMRLACKLQAYANEHYPGLMRPINVRAERFNQQITSGSLIVEVGSNGNTLDEAKLGARYMAEVISAVLLEEK